MKNKIISFLILILSVITFILTLPALMEYKNLSQANSYFHKKEYEKAREIYKKYKVDENILKSYYEEGKYDEVIKSKYPDGFLKGNSYVYKKDGKKKENLENAIVQYKKAMRESKDENIKKNYEIVAKMLEESKKDQKNQENQNQENSKKDSKGKENQNQENSKKDSKGKENQNQENSKKDQKNQENQNQENSKKDSKGKENQNQENSKKNQKNQENQNQENSKKDQKNQENQNQENSKKDSKGKEKGMAPTQGSGEKMKEEDVKTVEIRAILKRLEGNEKQAFKNNERVINVGDDSKNSNRW